MVMVVTMLMLMVMLLIVSGDDDNGGIMMKTLVSVITVLGWSRRFHSRLAGTLRSGNISL